MALKVPLGGCVSSPVCEAGRRQRRGDSLSSLLLNPWPQQRGTSGHGLLLQAMPPCVALQVWLRGAGQAEGSP